jgi:protein-S-isoprenylcysteine O-methyltransferase Ste14
MQLLFRVIGIITFSVVFWRHFYEFSLYPSKVLWLLEGLLFLGFILSYVIRKDPQSKAQGFRELIYPFFCAVLPFALVFELPDFSALQQGNWSEVLSYSPWLNFSHYYWVQWVMIGGTFLNVVALYYLRRSFSIATEVRELINKGVYRYISHPMYLGQYITAFGSAFLRGSEEKWLFFIFFLICQKIRSRIEERKLQKVFPEYKTHLQKCWIRI